MLLGLHVLLLLLLFGDTFLFFGSTVLVLYVWCYAFGSPIHCLLVSCCFDLLGGEG